MLTDVNMDDPDVDSRFGEEGSRTSIPNPGMTEHQTQSNPMTTPQKPIGFHSNMTPTGGTDKQQGTPTASNGGSLARRMSGKMSLGSLGGNPAGGGLHGGSSFTMHRESGPGVPDTPVISPPTTSFVTSPTNGSVSPPLSFARPPPLALGQGPPAAVSSPFANVPANSPWAHLAATSGIPTPSLEGPGGPVHSPFGPPSSASSVNPFGFPAGAQGRSISPHLGAPFELLNLGSAGVGATSSSRSPPPPTMGWPGPIPAQTPGLGTNTMADPFSSLPIPNASSTSTTTTAGSGRPREIGLGLDSLAAKLAKRRGSKSGPSGLSQSTSVGSSVDEEMDRDGNTAAGLAGRKRSIGAGGMPSSGPLSGPGRSALPMKLNLPPGMANRAAPTASTGPTSVSFTPGTSMSKSSGNPNGKTESTLPLPLAPGLLPPMLNANEGPVLILDLRPPSSFVQSHLPGALSLPVPSTLLKRPAFTIDKLAQMLSSKAAKSITRFKDAKEIVIIDQDSPIAAPGSVIVGLATKFGNAMSESESQARQGHVHFVKGGMAACQNLDGVQLETGQDESSEEEAEVKVDGTNSPGSPSAQAGRMIGRLDKMAFSSASASGVGTRRANPPKSLTLPNTPALDVNAPPAPGDQPMRALENDADGPTSEYHQSGGVSPRSGSIPGRAKVAEKQKLQPANPFFDNIRQNLELAHGGILERIPLEVPDDIKARANELPDFLRDVLTRPSPEVADQLAKEFERVERDEQKRLQGIMEWHSRGTRLEATKTPMVPGNLKRLASTGYIRTSQNQSDMDEHQQDDYFPFSITAGVERGSKNRYKNIWPYDFSRVRLKEKCYDDGSDYINANFIQPQGTTKRYIATQGPLDATFRDFWTLVWEQQVHVIVMLTKQFEGGACKCGAYWTGGQYGPFHLEHVSTEGGEDAAEKDVSGFNFHVGKSGPSAEAPNIKRTFLLSHTGHPDEKPRKIVQLQCVAWPDFDVPEDPRLLLGLVKEVDKAALEIPEEKDDKSRKTPVLVHCSAGVGRTGSFMVVDSILDGLRREHQRQHRKIRGSHSSGRARKTNAGEGGADERRPSSNSSLGADSPLASYQSNSSLHRLASNHLFNLASPNKEAAVFDKSPDNGRVSSPEPLSAGIPTFARTFSNEGPAKETLAGSKSPRTPDTHDGDMSFIPLITGEHQNDGDINSITEMDHPVQNVLGGMRVQRMSLVQSLRQYAFVYRAIIYGFLDILDEEKEAEAEVAAMHGGRGLSISGTNTDEESHIKRRASPTSLSGPTLHKRPSIKISRDDLMKTDGEETSRPTSGLSKS